VLLHITAQQHIAEVTAQLKLQPLLQALQLSQRAGPGPVAPAAEPWLQQWFCQLAGSIQRCCQQLGTLQQQHLGKSALSYEL
jgi:hypothetical protein